MLRGVSERREEVRSLEAQLDASGYRLGITGRFGAWLWVVLLGMGIVYEVLAFVDGNQGEPTLSQVVKALRRAGGVMGAVALTFAIIGAAVGLTLHLVVEAF